MNANENATTKLFGLTAFAVLIEALITYFNQFFVQGSFCWQMLVSIVLGVGVAIAYELDLPSFFNLKSKFPLIGSVITGILISRGSNYVFDLISKLTGL